MTLILSHITSRERLPSILENGLLVDQPLNGGIDGLYSLPYNNCLFLSNFPERMLDECKLLVKRPACIDVDFELLNCRFMEIDYEFHICGEPLIESYLLLNKPLAIKYYLNIPTKYFRKVHRTI